MSTQSFGYLDDLEDAIFAEPQGDATKSLLFTGKKKGLPSADWPVNAANEKVVNVGGKNYIVNEKGEVVVNSGTAFDASGKPLAGIDRNDGMFAAKKDLAVGNDIPVAAMIEKQSGELTPKNPFIDDVAAFDFPEPDKPKATKPDIAKIVAGYNPPTQVPGMTTYGLDPMQKAQLMQMSNPYKAAKGALNTSNTGAQGAMAGVLNVLHNMYGAGVPGGLSINPYKRQQQLDAIKFERPLTEKEIFDRTIELQKAGTPYAYSGAKEAMANALLQGNALQAAGKSDMANAMQNVELRRLQQAALKDEGATRREGMIKRYEKTSKADVNLNHSGGSGGGGTGAGAVDYEALKKLIDAK